MIWDCGCNPTKTSDSAKRVVPGQPVLNKLLGWVQLFDFYHYWYNNYYLNHCINFFPHLTFKPKCVK